MSQQAEMLHEFEQRRQAVSLEVAELRKNRDRINRELALLSEEFNGKDLRLENALAKLKALNTKFAVIEKRLKEVGTKTSLLRKKRSEWGDEAASVQQEIECAEAELSVLGRKKDELDQGISTLESGMKENRDAIETATEKKRDILAKLDACKLRRRALSLEIAACLAAGVSEKDQIDTDLNDITQLLMNRITERDGLKKALEDKETVMAALRQRVSELDTRRRLLEEAKIFEERRAELSGSISELNKEKERLGGKIAEQKALRLSRRKELVGLIGENSEKQNRLTGLEESVGIYDELLFHIEEAQKRQAELLQSKGQVSQDIEALMAENTRLDGELRMLESRIKAIVNLADSKNVDV